MTTLTEDAERILIIGNGGAGKTWLSRAMGMQLFLPVTHLDDIRWQPGHYGIARDHGEVIADATTLSAGDRWLMEGVYGWLARVILPRTTLLIWADLPETECLANIQDRGLQGGGSPETFQELLDWVATYRTRGGSSCYQVHLELYEAFEGRKQRLESRSQMADVLTDLVPQLS
jgi:adenylate kinase family enzyme